MSTLFDEILADPAIFLGGDGSPSVSGSPSFANTKIQNPGTGVSKINVNRFDAIEILTVDLSLVTPANLVYLLKLWRGGYGNAVGFRVRVPYDFTAVDEVFGTGNGVATVFDLVKTYTRPGVTARQDVRRIIKPVTNTNVSGGVTLYEANGVTNRVIPSIPAANLGVPTFTIKKAGVATSAYVINNTTGRITFTTPPANGASLTWSGEYDCPMRFSGNSFPLTKYDVSSEVKGIQLEEILPAELGIS